MNVISDKLISYMSPIFIPYITAVCVSDDNDNSHAPPYRNVTICKTLSDLVKWVSIQSLSQWHTIMIEYVNRSKKTEKDPLKIILLEDIRNELLVISCTLEQLDKYYAKYRHMWVCRDWRVGNVQNMHKDLIVSISIIHKKLELCDFIQDRFDCK